MISLVATAHIKLLMMRERRSKTC